MDLDASLARILESHKRPETNLDLVPTSMGVCTTLQSRKHQQYTYYLTQFYMGIKLKENSEGLNNPSPGTYDPSNNYTKSRVVGSAIGKATRTESLRPHSAAVGPGYYETIGKTGAGPRYGYAFVKADSVRASAME